MKLHFLWDLQQGAMGYEVFDDLAFYTAGLMFAYLSFFFIYCESQPQSLFFSFLFFFFVSTKEKSVSGYLTNPNGIDMMWCPTYA